jgi:glutamyl-tRNA reductase
MTSSSGEIVALVAHARDVPAAERERIGDTLRTGAAVPGLVLETCHRIEFYAVIDADNADNPFAYATPEGGRLLRREAAIRHAVSVAAGRDSVVVGENQILHQLRQAVDAARAAAALDPVLDRIFSTALRTGRRARTWLPDRPRSLADFAVDLVAQQARGLSGRDVLVVGTGLMGKLAMQAAGRAGARVAVASRSPQRADDVGLSMGAAGVEDFDPGSRLAAYSAILVALAGPWPLGPDAIDALGGSSTLVVDLSMPVAVPQALASVLGARLTTADDIAKTDGAVEHLPDRTLARLDRLIDESVEEVLTWLDRRERRAAAEALVERADQEREAELADLWRRLPDLDAEARATIEGMSRHLAERLLREPLERLGTDADGRHERAIRELWAL